MLDAKDLELLQAMMNNILVEIDKRFDQRFAQAEKNILDEVDKRMDLRFAQAEKNILDEVDKRMDLRFARSERKLLAEMDKRLAKSENLILNEMERVRKNLEDKIQTVQDNLEHIREYYQITRLEQGNTTLFLRIVSGLEKRVNHLEQKTM